ncbi:pentatricopeptide repeat-containing protein ELI1 chloroplastic [Prunus yedoensis var. nudiflora]|uniref:Pentatricopeptide repeat-containing protein ELI1 chloroplastic n=1 Tax=Prunus yedoensis var. nudiflora TaxID=2094558 RepID=A0A314Z9A2_PRUYE|nr:pentatricopeptide repeat-containing protein ELI1 chloroplastic [Prunus yedoensis var. nudiflora]
MSSSLVTTTPTHRQHPPSIDRLTFLVDKSKSIKHLLQTHALLLRHGLHHHPILNFKLQRSYASLGRLDYTVALFQRTHNPSVFFWTSIIHSHAQCGLHDLALMYYTQMLTNGVEPNCFTFSAVMKTCPLRPGKALHSQTIKLGFDSDLYVRTGLVDVYARAGDVVSARQLFDTMPEKSLVSLTAMITCYAKRGEVEEARVLFDGMEERDVENAGGEIKPNELTVLSLLSACGQLGALESGRWLHSYIENNGIQVNAHVGTALIDMYSKCGSLEDARLVFDMINEKDVVAWNSMIVGYAMHGFSRDALQLFHEMCRLSCQPTDITFIGVLSACAYAGLVSEGRAFFSSMKDEYGIEPKIEHYGCMVNLLSRAGQLEEAYEFVKNMKIDPDPVLWGTLLGACRLHGNITLGEEIAEFLLGQNLANSGTFILLSNIYAAAGNWDGVARVRTLMKHSGIQKEPGCSSIEVDNKVHEFLAGDRRSPRSKEIYMMIKEMNQWLKAHGYTPQIDTVLHDLGERERSNPLKFIVRNLLLLSG